MPSYEALRARHQADLITLLPEQIARVDWSVEQLRAERERGLRELLRAAKVGSPWHRERLAHVDPDAFTEEQLGELPAMTKDDLMAHWDDVVTDRRLSLVSVENFMESLTSDAYLHDVYHVVASGGSSGRRGVFAYGWEAWAQCCVGLARLALRDLSKDSETVTAPIVTAVVGADKPTHMTSALAKTFSTPTISTHRFPITLPLRELVAGLNAAQPTMLVPYASAIPMLAHEAEAGRLTISPLRISCTSEPLLPEIRQLAERTWGAPVGNMWGTTEGGPTGVSCALGTGMHLSDDLLIIEPVDEVGRPVLPGQRSAKLYLTNLYNPTTPLIRYEVTDEVTVLDEPCPCGSLHTRVADIQGRQDDCFAYADVIVHPIVFRSPLSRQRGVAEYQVRQTARGADIAVRTVGEIDVPVLRREVADGLAELGLADAEISILPVDGFERQGVGKLKRFLPLSSA